MGISPDGKSTWATLAALQRATAIAALRGAADYERPMETPRLEHPSPLPRAVPQPEHQARAGIPYDPTGPAVDEHINSRCACGAKLATQCDFGTCESPLIMGGHVLTPSEALTRNRRVVRVLLLIVVLLFAALCVSISFLIARPAHSLPEDSAPQHEYRKPIRVGPGGGAPPSQWR